MALTRQQNTIVTATSDFYSGTLVVVGVILSASTANATLALHDEASATPGATSKKFDLRVATSGTSQWVDLSSTPIRFDAAISAVIANGVVTLIIKEVGR